MAKTDAIEAFRMLTADVDLKAQVVRYEVDDEPMIVISRPGYDDLISMSVDHFRLMVEAVERKL